MPESTEIQQQFVEAAQIVLAAENIGFDAYSKERQKMFAHCIEQHDFFLTRKHV